MAKHTPAAEQLRLVELWRTTDLSMAAFARNHGVHPVTFGAWVARHRSEPLAPPAPPAFLQVVIPPATPITPTPLAVAIGGHILRFETPPPPACFAALVRELAPC
jgi:transposase-like protein